MTEKQENKSNWEKTWNYSIRMEYLRKVLKVIMQNISKNKLLSDGFYFGYKSRNSLSGIFSFGLPSIKQELIGSHFHRNLKLCYVYVSHFPLHKPPTHACSRDYWTRAIHMVVNLESILGTPQLEGKRHSIERQTLHICEKIASVSNGWLDRR